MKFMSINSKFNSIGTIIFDLMVLNVMWVIMNALSLGLLVGATTTALYYAINKSLIKSEENIYKCFFRMFKKRFVKSSIVYLILVIASSLSYLTFWHINTYYQANSVYFILFRIQMLFILVMAIYIFPLLAEKNMGIKEYFWTSYYLAYKYIHITIIAIISAIAIGYVLYTGPFIAIIVIGVSAQAYIIAQLVYKHTLTESRRVKRV